MTKAEIPPVSLAINHSNPDAFAEELGASFRRFGFAVIADHGLSDELIARALDRTRAFFALPDDVKRRYYQDGGGGARGYTPFGTENAKGATAKDLKEFWHVGRDLPDGHPHKQWMADNITPSEIDGWDALGELYTALDDLGGVILTAIARHLGLAENFFEDTVRDGNSVLRLLHYPPQAEVPEGSIRAAAHEDINTITLLLGAEEAGLQVKDRRDGRWIDISPPAGCLVINIGDMLQRLTNNALPSTSHRVVNPAPERQGFSRYSTPFFLHFRPGYEIKTLPSCITDDNPDQYPEPITSQAYLEERLREIGLM